MTVAETTIGDFPEGFGESPWREEEILEGLYLGSDLTQSEIGDLFGCTTACVNKYIKRYDISKTQPWQKPESLLEHYPEKSFNEIADVFDVTHRTIIQNFRDLGLLDEDSTDECPECGEYFVDMGSHWRYHPSHRPQLTDEEHQVIVGLLMGDGSLKQTGETSRVRINCVEERYIDWLKDFFGPKVGYKFDIPIDKENHKDQYGISTRSFPELTQYNDWYSTGKKVYPEDIELEPLVLKTWFVGDGSLGVMDRVRTGLILSCSNESENPSKVKELFSDIDVEPKVIVEESEYHSNGRTMRIFFSPDDTSYLFDYMGDAVPGYEYKFHELAEDVPEEYYTK